MQDCFNDALDALTSLFDESDESRADPELAQQLAYTSHMCVHWERERERERERESKE